MVRLDDGYISCSKSLNNEQHGSRDSRSFMISLNLGYLYYKVLLTD